MKSKPFKNCIETIITGTDFYCGSLWNYTNASHKYCMTHTVFMCSIGMIPIYMLTVVFFSEITSVCLLEHIH